MRFERTRLFVNIAVAMLCLPALVHAQTSDASKGKAPTPKFCAFSAVNGNCTLVLDRLNPVVPPTIYVRRGDQVTVVVSNPLPFEHLTMGEKSAAAQIPPDNLANGFAAITTALGGLQVASEPGANAQLDRLGAKCIEDPRTRTDIMSCQNQYQQELKAGLDLNLGKNRNPVPDLNFATWAYSRLCWVRILFLPLTPGAVSPANATPVCDDLPTNYAVRPIPKSEEELTQWKADFSPSPSPFLSPDKKKLIFPSDELGKNIDALDRSIAQSKQMGSVNDADLVEIKAKQKALHASFDTAQGYQAKMQGLLDAVNALPETEVHQFTISDLHAFGQDGHRDKNNELDVWDLNSNNELASIAVLAKADKYGEPIQNRLDSLADAPTTHTIVEFKVDFVNVAHLEISSGLLFPVRQYHSYSLATPYSSATATVGCSAGTATSPSAPTNCPIVQQTLTFAVVPDVSFNFPFHQMILGQQRAAWMFTIAPGYNSATTTATLGAGLSFAYRSLVFSALPLADRDVKLTGPYQVNQSAGTASAPTTANVWRFNLSVGVSLRVALAGGSN